MTKPLHIILAQINPVVGDLDHNADRIRKIRDEAPENTDLIIFPETVLCGYPAEDLLLKPFFIDRVTALVEKLVSESAEGGPALLLTAPARMDGTVKNAAHLIVNGRILASIGKSNLPNYGVFDEQRVFTPGPLPAPVNFRGHKLGVMICEDMWNPAAAASLRDQGATILIVPNASPFAQGKQKKRKNIARERVAETNLPLIYVNQIGGQDDIVFDGGSFILNEKGGLVFEAEHFFESITHTTWERTHNGHWLCAAPHSAPPAENEIYQAAMLGLRDYIFKNGFPGVVLGMSGGIDSALAAAIAVDAIGADNVHAVMMPSIHTTQDSLDHAAACSRALGIRHDIIAIRDTIRALENTLNPFLNADIPGTTFENLQSRARGIILMALSNANGKMVLSTGNKSEIAVGYSTLYGDMCGGYNPLKDIYKTEIYRLAAWRNENVPPHSFGPAGPVIPAPILTKAPTAELRPDQTDQDSLPPYDILDGILHGLIEEDLAPETLIQRGYDRAKILRVWALLDRAEYKRRQAPPGPKISSRAFDRERRYPITNHFLKHVENQR